MMLAQLLVAAGASLFPSDLLPLAQLLKEEAIVLTADEVYVGDGTVYRPGTVVLLRGKVAAVGPNPGLPLSSRHIKCGTCTITPGLVDAAAQVGTHSTQGFSEQSSEVIAHLDVRDSVDLHSRSLQRLGREGVTTICVTPEAASVIGSKGAVIKTGGTGVSRFVDAPGFIKINPGPEAWQRGGRNRTPRGTGADMYTRRPTTRMGSYWVLRKAFYDAIRLRDTGTPGDAPEAALEALADVFTGKLQLRFQARQAHDIQGAQSFGEEFGVKYVLEYANEAGQSLATLKANEVPLIYGPIFKRATGVTASSGADADLSTPRELEEHGIQYCLTACDLTGEQGLARQAGLAMRFGLSTDQALKAVTSSAATILGVDGQVGSLQTGHDADLVVWSGKPMDDTSKPVLVLIDGKPVRDDNGWFDATNDVSTDG